MKNKQFIQAKAPTIRHMKNTLYLLVFIFEVYSKILGFESIIQYITRYLDSKMQTRFRLQ